MAVAVCADAASGLAETSSTTPVAAPYSLDRDLMPPVYSGRKPHASIQGQDVAEISVDISAY